MSIMVCYGISGVVTCKFKLTIKFLFCDIGIKMTVGLYNWQLTGCQFKDFKTGVSFPRETN